MSKAVFKTRAPCDTVHADFFNSTVVSFNGGRKKKIYVKEINEQEHIYSVLVNIWLQLIVTQQHQVHSN